MYMFEIMDVADKIVNGEDIPLWVVDDRKLYIDEDGKVIDGITGGVLVESYEVSEKFRTAMGCIGRVFEIDEALKMYV